MNNYDKQKLNCYRRKFLENCVTKFVDTFDDSNLIKLFNFLIKSIIYFFKMCNAIMYIHAWHHDVEIGVQVNGISVACNSSTIFLVYTYKNQCI